MADIKLLVLDLVGTMVADDGQVDRAFERALGTYGLKFRTIILGLLC